MCKRISIAVVLVQSALSLAFVTVAGTFTSEAVPDAESRKEYRLIKPKGGLLKGFSWREERGPDFVVFRANSRKEPAAGLGMYVGLHPSFRGPNASCTRAGTVAGHAVTWCVEKQGNKKSEETFVQTLLEGAPCAACLPLRLHIWAGAPTPARVDDLLQKLESVKFFDDNDAITLRVGVSEPEPIDPRVPVIDAIDSRIAAIDANDATDVTASMIGALLEMLPDRHVGRAAADKLIEVNNSCSVVQLVIDFQRDHLTRGTARGNADHILKRISGMKHGKLPELWQMWWDFNKESSPNEPCPRPAGPPHPRESFQ